MKVQITLGSPLTRDGRYLASAVRHLLYGLTKVNLAYLQRHKVPSLYHTGVRYRPEPPGSVEMFDDIPTVLGRGWGDCDDLAPFRLAQLWKEGETGARLRIRWVREKWDSPRLFHVNIRRAPGVQIRRGLFRALDGHGRPDNGPPIEDPSVLLGMPTPPIYSP